MIKRRLMKFFSLMSDINTIINRLNTGSSIVLSVLSIVNFIPGSIGLIFNVVVLIRPQLRREPCSLYFLTSTFFNLFVTLIILPVRFFSNNYGLDLSRYNLSICKIENYIFYVARSSSCWFIVLACVDRYLHSSSKVGVRRLSSLKTARITIGITIILMLILYIHMLIYYDIANTSNQVNIITIQCNAQKGFYRIFIAFWYLMFYSLIPSFFMLLFGFLTLKNIHRPRQVFPVVNVNNLLSRRTNNQLIRMLITQVLFFIITTLPYAINILYGSLTANVSKSTLRIAQENLASQIVNTMTYFAHTSSFYLYILTGSVFRKEFLKLFTCCPIDNRNPIPIPHV